METRNTVDGRSNTKEVFALNLGEQPNGAPYLLPVMTVNGAVDGPTVFVNAAMHGDEILGIEAVRQAWRLLDPGSFKGRLVMIPMANYSGVATRTRRNVLEMYPGPHDMNRVFPGAPNGIMTERIAATIMREFVSRADYTFDIHCASVGGEWLPYVAVPGSDSSTLDADLVKASRRLGLSFGAPMVLEDFLFPGSLVQAALAEGKPASMVEFGVASTSTRPERIWGRTGVIRIAIELGMHEGEVPMFDDTPVPPVPEPHVVREFTKIISDRGGFFHRRKFPGDKVLEGDSLAVLMSLDGHEIADFKAPHDGLLIRSNTMGVIGTGDIVGYVGKPL